MCLNKLLLLDAAVSEGDQRWYEDALSFKDSYRPEGFIENPSDDVKAKRYAWLRDYGRDKQRELLAACDKLDDKADNVIKYLGGGTAILTVVSVLSLNHGNAWIAICYLPTLMCALVAIRSATKVRLPRDLLHLPRLDQAIKLVELGGENQMLGQLHFSCASLNAAHQEKAVGVSRALRAFYWALLLLLLPLFAWSMAKMAEAPATQKVEIKTSTGSVIITKH